MKNFQKKDRLKRILESKLFLTFLGIILVFFLFNIFSLVVKMEDTIKNKKIVEDKIIELEKSKEKLNSDIGKLKTNEGVEENIREKFGLVKDGENMIMIIDNKNEIEDGKQDDSSGFFSFFKNLFK